LPEGDVPTTEYYDRRMPEKRLLPAGLLLEVDDITDNTLSWGCFVTPTLIGFFVTTADHYRRLKGDVHEPQEV
jgi:hypothetical protein